MREWHLKHVEQTITRFVRGISVNATRWEVKLNNKYGKINQVIKKIDYNVKHGVTNDQVFSFMQSMRTDSNYLTVMSSDGSTERLNELQSYYEFSSSQLTFSSK